MPAANRMPSPSGGLRLIAQAASANQAATDLIIIAIPWLMKATRFAIHTNPSAFSQSNCNIYSYEVIATVDENFAWRDLLERGNMLVSILDSHRKQNESRPIVLMAHSLAGFVLKQCLVVADVQKDRYRSLQNVFKGAIFMGSPHAILEERREALYDSCASILRLFNGKRVNGSLETNRDLLNVCRQFDGLCGRIKIISLYEQRDTKVPHRLISTSQHIVEKHLAKVTDFSTGEFLTGINTDHIALPSLKDVSGPGGIDEAALREINLLLGSDWKTTSNPDPIQLETLIGDFGRLKIPNLPQFLVEISRKRNPNFYGRKEVFTQLEEKLLSGSQTTILHGLGGLGKSEVALEFAYRHRDLFDAVFWIQADDISKMRHDFGNFAYNLGLEEGQHSTEPFTSRELVKEWLMNPIKDRVNGNPTMAKWLIVFDGADSPEVLSEFGSIHGKGSILITGRDPTAVERLTKVSKKSPETPGDGPLAIRMHPFEVEEAAAVLKKLAHIPQDEEDEAAEEIATLLGGWPLAISQMAGIIRTQYMTLTQFHETYSNVGIRCNLQAQESQAVQDAGRDTMVSSMRMAKLSNQAIALLRVFAMLDPDCIQERLFATITDGEVELDGFPVSQDEFKLARNELLRSSLVELNKTKQQLWMHRVLQDTVRGQCTKKELDCSFRTAATLVRKAFDSPSSGVLRDSLKLWNSCATLLRHVLHFQYVYESQAKADSGDERTIQPCFEFAWLLSEVACFQRNLGNTSGLKSTLLLALSICDDPPGLPPKDTFVLRTEIYHSLGAWANETNHPEECVDYNTRYLAMAIEAVREEAPPDERTAMAYNQFGTGQMMIHQYSEAMEAFQTSIDIYKSLSLATECPDSLPKVNLAVAKWLTGDYEGAMRLLEAGRLAREEAFGFMDKESFRTGRFFHTLGNVCWSQGREVESITWHTRALDQYISALGHYHHRTSDVRHRVAEHCIRKGELAQAGTLIDQALQGWRLDPSSFRQEIARTTWLKARQRGKSGNPIEARELREEAYQMRRQLVPDDERPMEELSDRDFDDLVAFWSR